MKFVTKIIMTSRYTSRKPTKGGWLVYDNIAKKNLGSFKTLPTRFK